LPDVFIILDISKGRVVLYPISSFLEAPRKSQIAFSSKEKNVLSSDKKSDLQKLEKHKIYSLIAKDTKSDMPELDIPGYKRVLYFNNSQTGFNATIYENKYNNELVLAYRGTDNREGVLDDIKMLQNCIPEQYHDAIKIYDDVLNCFPNKKIVVIGHSLGGSLAQLVASTYPEVEAVTFDPYGTSQIIEKYGLKDNKNCTNYTTDGSVVSSVSLHPGETKTVLAKPVDFAGTTFNLPIIKKHSIDNYTNMSPNLFANEKLQNLKRTLNQSVVQAYAANILPLTPGVETIVPSLFF